MTTVSPGSCECQSSVRACSVTEKSYLNQSLQLQFQEIEIAKDSFIPPVPFLTLCYGAVLLIETHLLQLIKVFMVNLSAHVISIYVKYSDTILDTDCHTSVKARGHQKLIHLQNSHFCPALQFEE